MKKNHPFFKVYQRIGSTGILKGHGVNVGWSNQNWFYPEKNIDFKELMKDLSVYFNLKTHPLNDLKIDTIFKWISLISKTEINNTHKIWIELGLKNFNKNRLIQRGEFAVILDYFLNPFEKFKVNFEGEIVYDK